MDYLSEVADDGYLARSSIRLYHWLATFVAFMLGRSICTVQISPRLLAFPSLVTGFMSVLTVAIGFVALLGLGAELPFGLILVIACLIGALAGCQFTSFIYIMITKTDMTYDLEL